MSYERIFMPQLPLYEAAGSDAITKFGDRNGKNLVLIPEAHLIELERTSRSRGPGSLAAKNALESIHTMSREANAYDSEFSEPIRVGDRLDIGFTKLEAQGSDGLENIVRQAHMHYSIQPTIITPEPSSATMLRLRGIPVERPDFLIVASNIVEKGMIEGSPDLEAALYENNGEVEIEYAHQLLGFENEHLLANQFITFENSSTYARVVPRVRTNKDGFMFETDRSVQLTRYEPFDVLGIHAQDMEQFLALEHILLNNDISLGFVTGSQGSGKTLLTYVAAVDSILKRSGQDWTKPRFADRKSYELGRSFEQIVLFKSNDIVGGSHRDPGALPGDLWQKINQFMQSYIDAHRETPELSGFSFEQMLMNPRYEDSFGKRHQDVRTKGNLRLPQDRPAIELAYSGFVRGRTFIDSYIIIDEAQNFTPYEIKTLIERAGRGSKIIITGDPLQVDNPRCSVEINGLTSAMRHFMDKPYVASLNLSQSYRSQASSDSRTWNVF